MLTVCARTALLFVITVVAVRAMGKRQLAQLQPFEVVITLMIAELAAVPMGDVGLSLYSGVVSILTLLFLHSLITVASFRSRRLRALICGRPSVLVRRGQVQLSELRRLCFDLDDLLEGMRAQGLLNVADVETAVLETNGALNAFARSQRRPPTAQELGVRTPYEGMPLLLVLDGQVQAPALGACGRDEAWLLSHLREMGFAGAGELLLCSLDTQGELFAQARGGEPRRLRAMEPQEVRW